MKKLFLFVAILIVAFSFNSCGDEFFQDRPVASNELMNPIKDFITNHFPDWTIAFADRTDGVIMLGDTTLAMKPITSTGITKSTSFTSFFACYTSDNKFTVNDNTFTVDGEATITLSKWVPNKYQLEDINKIPEIKKYRYFFEIRLSNHPANNVIVTFNPDITVNQPTPPEPPKPVEKKYNLLDSVPAGYDVKGWYHYDGNNNLVFDNIDVSQLKYNKGDTLPDFCLTIKDGYEYDGACGREWTRCLPPSRTGGGAPHIPESRGCG